VECDDEMHRGRRELRGKREDRGADRYVRF